jgi:hypothetical protein
MTGFAGTGQLSKLAFRRDGVVLPACVFGIAALLAITARDLKVLYPTAASRLAVAAKVTRASQAGTARPCSPTWRSRTARAPGSESPSARPARRRATGAGGGVTRAD